LVQVVNRVKVEATELQVKVVMTVPMELQV
jgi:hypothetical protein